jgi:hypothetical protein
VNTFLPYSSFDRCARALDTRRLGKQRVEAFQILRTLLGISKGWKTHPAVLMWRGHERALADYGLAICREWIRRGYTDTVAGKIAALTADLPDTGRPAWTRSRRLHLSHRSNLVRKDAAHYGKFWDIAPDLPYIWPATQSPKPQPQSRGLTPAGTASPVRG